MNTKFDIINLFYILCEYLGKIIGKVHAFILNLISSYIILLMKGIQKAEEKYVDILAPIYSKYRKDYKENFFDTNNNIENIVNSI